MFKINDPTFKCTVMSMVKIITDYVYNEVVDSYKSEYITFQMHPDGTKFHHFKYAWYPTDVKFQQANRPSVNHEMSFPHFSNKHHLYGIKVEVSVLPNGLAIMATTRFAGHEHDFDIFNNHLNFHKSALRKTEEEMESFNYITDNVEEYSHSWAALPNRRFQSALDLI